MAIKITFASDVSAVTRDMKTLGDRLHDTLDELQGIDRAGSQAGAGLDDLAQDSSRAAEGLDDAQRAMRETADAGDRMGRDLADAGDGFERMAEGVEKDAKNMSDNVEKAFRNMADETRAKTKKVADDTGSDMHRASEATETFKDEARSNLAETASSFDGSLESIVDGLQGTFGGVAADLGPAGMIGGALAGAALGTGMAIAQNIADGINEKGDIAADLAEDIRGVGGALDDVDFTARMEEWGTAIQDQRKWWELWQDTAQTGLEDVRENADKAGVSFEDMFKGASGSIEDARAALDIIDQKLEDIAQRDGIVAKANPRDLEEQRRALEELRGQIEDNIDVQEQAKQIEEDRAKAIGVTTDQLLEQVDAQDKLSDTMSDSVGSQLDYLDALDQVREGVEKNGAVHGTATKAARDNERGLIDLKDAAYDMAAAQIAAGESTETVSGQLAQQRADFIAVATSMGYTTSEAEGLADAYGLVPSQVITDVQAKGVDQTKAQLNGIERNIGVSVDVKERGVQAARNAIALIPREVTTTVRVRRVGDIAGRFGSSVARAAY